MDAPSVVLVAVSGGGLLVAWAWSLRRFAVALRTDACPVCEGFGTLRVGRDGVVRCDDCRGEGSAAALVPDHVPPAWE